MPGSPLIWVAVLGWLCTAGAAGFHLVRKPMIWQAGYSEGRSAGVASVSAKGVEAATQTVTAINQAREDTAVPVDKAAIMALCKKSASCRERDRIK